MLILVYMLILAYIDSCICWLGYIMTLAYIALTLLLWDIRYVATIVTLDFGKTWLSCIVNFVYVTFILFQFGILSLWYFMTLVYQNFHSNVFNLCTLQLWYIISWHLLVYCDFGISWIWFIFVCLWYITTILWFFMTLVYCSLHWLWLWNIVTVVYLNFGIV